MNTTYPHAPQRSGLPARLSIALMVTAIVGCSADEPHPASDDLPSSPATSGVQSSIQTPSPLPVDEPDSQSAVEGEEPQRDITVEPIPGEDMRHTRARRKMVNRDLAGPGRDIANHRVLEAMARVPRHRFVPKDLEFVAYDDRPLPIGYDQTISQPYIVALMTQLVDPQRDAKALDVGTGSGYQAAVLAELCRQVYSIEIVKPLADEASARLTELGYDNVTVRHGDGYRGWKENAPFDAIVVAAAPDHVPKPLIDQLAPGGRLVIPVGRGYQELVLLEKAKDGTISRKSIANVAFVPMTGEAREK